MVWVGLCDLCDNVVFFFDINVWIIVGFGWFMGRIFWSFDVNLFEWIIVWNWVGVGVFFRGVWLFGYLWGVWFFGG